MRDYIADIPVSNLVHVVRGKRVLLVGNQTLCGLLAQYLERVENGEVEVSVIRLGQTIETRSGDMRCLVIPDYRNARGYREKKLRERREALSAMNFRSYSEYLVNCVSFALIDLFLNACAEKYSVSELAPKGILLGRIPGASGNVFFRGILNGHPELLQMNYSDSNNHLFYYCVCLAHVRSEEVLDRLREMCEGGACGIRELPPDIPDWEGFAASARSLLKLKESVTSQELFVLLHIAYMEMATGEQAGEISRRTVYWEPHFVDRNKFPFFELWLEDQKIRGQTIVLCRNNVVRTGSACKRRSKGAGDSPHDVMFCDDSLCNGVYVTHHNWSEFKIRFEDLKLRPREMLEEVCGRLGIA